MASAVWDRMDDEDASLVHPSVMNSEPAAGAPPPRFTKEEVLDAWRERFGRTPEPAKMFDMIIQLFLRKAVDMLGDESLPVAAMRAKTYFDSETAENPAIVLTETEIRDGVKLCYEERRERANEAWANMSGEQRAPYEVKERSENARFRDECIDVIERLRRTRA